MFKTNRPDGVPPWRVVYDYIRGKEPAIDDVFSHEELQQVADAGDYYYATMARVSRELERHDKRTLETVRGEGYRYTAGVRHVERAGGYRKRGKRAMSRALQLASSADYSVMDAEGRAWADRQRNAFAAMCQILKQHDEKLIKVADELRDVHAATIRTSQRQAATEEQIADIERQLAELRRSRAVAA